MIKNKHIQFIKDTIEFTLDIIIHAMEYSLQGKSKIEAKNNKIMTSIMKIKLTGANITIHI